MYYPAIICLAIAALSVIFSLYRQLQMLQQNSYFPSRYFKWVNESYAIELAISVILFCATAYLLLSGETDKIMVMGAILAAFLIVRYFLALNTAKKSIKKLVFTARVKRLLCAALLLVLIPFAVFVWLPSGAVGEAAYIICLLLCCASPLLTVLAWAVTLPIEKAAAAHYTKDARRILKEHSDLTVVGITGSYGKTTTKFILNRILSEKYNTVCTPQSFNTPMGVVRTIRESIKPQTQIFVCEMGAKKTCDIKEICDIVNPKYGIITSVGPQHLDTFKTEDRVFATKFELADAVKASGGICLANLDSAGIKERAAEDENTVFFGNNTKYYAENISYGAFGSTFDLVLDGERINVTTKLLGHHSITDILAAAAMAHILGVGADEIKFAISSLKATEHRLELKPFREGSLMIDDAYNANPEGCLEAVRVLSSFEGMKKAIITPGLIELGSREYECNYALGLEAAKHCDIIILVGQNRSKPMRDAIDTTDFNTENLYVVSSFREAMEIYSPLADENSVVLLENDLPDNYLN